MKRTCVRSGVGILSGLFLISASVAWPASAPNPFLPPEISACAQQFPVTGVVPPNGQPDPAPEDFSGGFFHVGKVADGLFFATDGNFQAVFAVDREGIILVDAPPSIGFNPLDPASSVSIVDVIFSIPETQGKKIKTMIYSHPHLDHIGQASKVVDRFPDVEIIAQIETTRKIRSGTGELGNFNANAGTNPPPVPTRSFSRRRTVRLGKQIVRLSYAGPIHEVGNSFIHFPKQRSLMVVDVVIPGSAQFFNLEESIDIPRFVDAFDQILAFDFDTFIGGHDNRLGTRADVVESKAYVQDIVANAAVANRDPSANAIFGILPSNGLVAFAISRDEVACICANRTLDPAVTPSGTDWRGRLKGADYLTVTSCFAAAEAQRIDPSF